jgi:hypothetical protein
MLHGHKTDDIILIKLEAMYCQRQQILRKLLTFTAYQLGSAARI